MTQIDELVQKMLDLDEDTLKAQLGIRAQAIAQDTTARSASLESLEDALSATPRGSSLDTADVDFGDRLFKRLNLKSYNLMCGELFDDKEIQNQLQTAFKESVGKGAGFLTPVLAANLALAYPVAVIIAAMIIKTISSATAETICEVWNEKLPDEKDLPESKEKAAATSIS